MTAGSGPPRTIIAGQRDTRSLIMDGDPNGRSFSRQITDDRGALLIEVVGVVTPLLPEEVPGFEFPFEVVLELTPTHTASFAVIPLGRHEIVRRELITETGAADPIQRSIVTFRRLGRPGLPEA